MRTLKQLGGALKTRFKLKQNRFQNPATADDWETYLQDRVKQSADLTGKLADTAGDLIASESWKHVLRGLWSSALRLEELMHVSWDKPGTIRPVWKDGRLPVLEIPATMQKNDTEESIPLLPWFETVLRETALEKRKGWMFQTQSLQLKLGRKVRYSRPDAE